MVYNVIMNIEYAWAAGFWDGEGCVSVARRNNTNNPRIVAEIAQVHPEVLYRFATAVGFGKVLGPYKQKNPNAQDFYCWRVEGLRNLKRLKGCLYSHLGSVKRMQLDRALLVREEWEADPRCQSDHVLTMSKGNKFYCKECVTANGRANALPERSEKRCGRCDTVKSLEEFNRHSKRLDGHQTMCRSCMKTYRDERSGG
jgi:hypothetical protein